jgi:hypothetical protein
MSEQARGSDSSEPVFISLMLQRHRAATTRILVTSVISRLVCVGVAVYVTLLEHLSVPQAMGVVVVTAMIAASWLWSNRRNGYELEGIEEAISRQFGGRGQDFFIESRAGSYRHWGNINYLLTTYEPFIWIIINGALLVASVLINGIDRWHGLG